MSGADQDVTRMNDYRSVVISWLFTLFHAFRVSYKFCVKKFVGIRDIPDPTIIKYESN